MIEASSAASCSPRSHSAAAASSALRAAKSSLARPPSVTRTISDAARSGRSRTQSVANSSAARALPMWLAANASVSVRGSLRIQSPGSPISRSGGTT